MDIITIIVITMAIVLAIAMTATLCVFKKVINSAFKDDNMETKALKDEVKDLQESVDQIYEDYQDIGKMFFDLKDKTDVIVIMCSKDYLNKETKELANEILKILDVHATAIPIKNGTAKKLERLIF